MSGDKRKAFESIFNKLEKLVPHLGNPNEHEAGVALKKINNVLRSAKLDWHDFLTLVFERESNILELLMRLMEKDADTLVRLGRAGGTFFCSPAGVAFVDVMIDGNRLTWPLSSAEFRDWLLHLFYLERKKAPATASEKSAIRTLGAHARFEGERHEVYLRVAGMDGKIFVDVGDPEWHVIEIGPDGWRVVDHAPVRFRRAAGMTTLPLPQRGGSIDQLRRFVNLTETNFILFVSVLADALRPDVPHPVLYLAGEEGSAKTTATNIARSLVDPSDLPEQSLPGTVREIFVNAHSARVLPFGNISVIRPQISDALCQLASGSGFATRQLYTDLGLIRIGGSRSVVLNGLANAITRSDLADRAVVLSMPVVKPKDRLAESKLWREFEAERPQILGVLLDIVAHGLRQLPQVRLSRLPRMADFALWGVACEGAFTQPGAFIAALEAHAEEATGTVIENDPVALAVVAFMENRIAWTGTATALLKQLTHHDHAEAEPSTWRSWPRDASAFGKALRKVAGVLRRAGVEVTCGETPDHAKKKFIKLQRIEHPPSTQATDTADTTNVAGSAGGAGGDANGTKRAIAKATPLRKN
jgi:hypothetical protein